MNNINIDFITKMSNYLEDSQETKCLNPQECVHSADRTNATHQIDGIFASNKPVAKERAPNIELTVIEPLEGLDKYLDALTGDRNMLMRSNEKGFTSLHQLVFQTSNSHFIQKAIQTLKTGLNFKSDAGRQNNHGHSPLFLSILLRNKTFTLEFLKAGAPIDQTDQRGRTIFHYLAERNAQVYTEEIFKNYTFKRDAVPLLDIWDRDGVTPMQLAVLEGNMVAFQNFYQFGEGQLKQRDKKRGYSMQHLAAEKGNTYLTDVLIRKKVINVDERGFDDATPLHVAVANGHLEVVRSLLDAGADAKLFLRESSLLGLIPEECKDQMRQLISQKVDEETFMFISDFSEMDYSDYSDSEDDA